MSIKLLIVATASLAIGAYFFLNEMPEREEAILLESSSNENNLPKAKTTLKTDTDIAEPQKESAEEEGSVVASVLPKQEDKDDHKLEKNPTTLANNPDEFGNEQEIEYEPLSIGEFIPALPAELIALEQEYKSTRKNNTVQTEAEIQAEFESFNAEVNAVSIGKEIEEFIPVDGIAEYESAEGIEIGEFIPVD